MIRIQDWLHDEVDTLHYLGMIHIRALPPITREEYLSWWPHLSEKERERYEVAVCKNLITTAGRTQILTFVGNNGTTQPFSQYFSVGTFPINSVSPGDTSVATELYRAVPSNYTVTGNNVDISTFFGTAQANGTLTNCGLYGGGSATSTLGTGTLYTHALINSYVKTNLITVTFDYIITLQ